MRFSRKRKERFIKKNEDENNPKVISYECRGLGHIKKNRLP